MVRVKQRWGIGHVTAVLEGRVTPQVTAQGHDALSTFGLLQGHAAGEIRGYIEQLVSTGVPGADERRVSGAADDRPRDGHAGGQVDAAE